MGNIFVSSPIKGQPEKFESLVQKKIYDIITDHEIDFERVENDPAVTMEDCKAIDKAFGVETIKTVFLTNRQKTKFYLLGMPADKPFITKDFGAALSIPRVSFADENLLELKLNTPRGAASPLIIIIDESSEIALILDKELLSREKIVCTDGTLHGFISISVRDLMKKYFPATGHEPILINL